MAEERAINVDFAVMEQDNGDKTTLAWGDRVLVHSRTATKLDVEITDWTEQPDGSVLPVARRGSLRRKVKVGNEQREVALPKAEVGVLRVAFVDVQQGDGAVIETPGGRVLTIDGGQNQLFARYLASRYRGTSDGQRQRIDAMVVSHGDADHFAGLTEIHDSETTPNLKASKRLFIHPDRVFHNGLVKRPSSRPELEQLGATVGPAKKKVITGLVDSPLDVADGDMNTFFKAWAKALRAWKAGGPIEFRRLAKGVQGAFDFLAAEHISVEVLGPVETMVGPKPGLAFLAGPKEGDPLAHLDFEPGAQSVSHTINGHSVVLRLQMGNVRLLFAGDLNNAAEETLFAEHEAGNIDLESEILKVPHHGSHEFTPKFLQAVSPLVSVVSSGDESARTEYIHPRATLMSALGRYGRDGTSVVFVTELVAFFEMKGWSVTTKDRAKPKPPEFFAFRRSAYGLVRVRTDGHRLLVFTDTGKRDLKEAYAYEVPAPGTTTPVELIKAGAP